MLARVVHCYGRNIFNSNRTKIAQHAQMNCSFSTNGTAEGAPVNDKNETKDEQDSSNKEDDVKLKIFTAALPLVPQYGWTKECLEAGAESIGYSKSSQGIFEQGGASFVQFFHKICNKELREIALRNKLDVSNTSDELSKVQILLEKRLQMILPHLSKWPQAMALMARPQSSLESYKLIYELSDDICYFAGDRSFNATWYTKRAAVAGLYITGELSLVQDKSIEFGDTWSMLSRRIEDLRKVEEFGGHCDKQQKILRDIAESSLTMIRNLVGMQSYRRNSR
ncbi:ubiquinone biosynthesis protein COQ9, mitochondrial [Neocloeon triangulifer]|uniref:ubiquinone biosynthesis protein COQ9, mitochondrial n=1 Tax=Neocloeon triangulifer TaxID=2078957 RepID=UPI00286EB4EE|nr:ubiquinone biosynthesis protein COQ9, mitochondrial [Neocloeon triangulifer]